MTETQAFKRCPCGRLACLCDCEVEVEAPKTPIVPYKKPAHWVVTCSNEVDAFCFGVFYTQERAEAALVNAGWIYDGEFWLEPPGESLLVKRYWAKNKMKASVTQVVVE